MQTSIIGSVLPVLEITLNPGEAIISETGQLSWMSGGIAMHTSAGGAGSSGFFGAISRAVAGGGLFMTQYRADGGPGMVAFAAKIPGHIIEVEVHPGQGYMVHRHGFLCATEGVTLTLGLQQSLGAGIFGGNGFVLQQLGGAGRAFVELGGEVIQRELGMGEVLRVHPGHVGMFEASVRFDITTVPGIRNMIFGGDGIFLAELTGPGRVWLQTLTLPDLAHALSPYFTQGGDGGGGNLQTAAEIGIAGAVLKSIFK